METDQPSIGGGRDDTALDDRRLADRLGSRHTEQPLQVRVVAVHPSLWYAEAIGGGWGGEYDITNSHGNVDGTFARRAGGHGLPSRTALHRPGSRTGSEGQSKGEITP